MDANLGIARRDRASSFNNRRHVSAFRYFSIDIHLLVLVLFLVGVFGSTSGGSIGFGGRLRFATFASGMTAGFAKVLVIRLILLRLRQGLRTKDGNEIC